MKILTNKQQKELIKLLVANQIIINAFDTLDGIPKFETFSRFCENTTKALNLVSSPEELEKIKKEVIF